MTDRTREPTKTLAWLRRDVEDRRRRKFTPRRIDLLRAMHADPRATFRELGAAIGCNYHAAWQLAQRCVRDGLLEEHRPITNNGTPSVRARYTLTDAGRAVATTKGTDDE